jgi:hypothetical protein
MSPVLDVGGEWPKVDPAFSVNLFHENFVCRDDGQLRRVRVTLFASESLWVPRPLRLAVGTHPEMFSSFLFKSGQI